MSLSLLWSLAIVFLFRSRGSSHGSLWSFGGLNRTTILRNIHIKLLKVGVVNSILDFPSASLRKYKIFTARPRLTTPNNWSSLSLGVFALVLRTRSILAIALSITDAAPSTKASCTTAGPQSASAVVYYWPSNQWLVWWFIGAWLLAHGL